MAAGLGFKTFNTGDVLSAADVNGYLMQGILVFASAAARDAAITSPEEGQFAFLKDTNVTTYYTGSAWANVDTTGMTNPMTTTGDVIYSSSGSTPARLGLGTAGQVLQVNSGATAPEWATAATGGKVLQVIQDTLLNEISTTSGTLADTGLTVTITPSSASSKVLVIANMNGVGKTSAADTAVELRLLRGATTLINTERNSYSGQTGLAVGSCTFAYLDSPATTSATTYKIQYCSLQSGSTSLINTYQGVNDSTSTIIVFEIGA